MGRTLGSKLVPDIPLMHGPVPRISGSALVLLREGLHRARATGAAGWDGAAHISRVAARGRRSAPYAHL